MKLKTQQLKKEEAPGAGTPRASGTQNQPAKEGNCLMNNSIVGNSTPIVSINNGQLVTTSLAIAEGVGNPHKSVIQLIRQNVSDLNDFGGVAFENAPFETAGGTQSREVAILNEQQSTLLLTYMRNNDVVRKFKKRLVKAFFEMRDSGVKNADPMQALSDPATMRGLLLSYSEKVLTLESTVKEQAPQVEAFKRLSVANGSLCLTDAAKHIQIKPKEMIQWMHAKSWIYRRTGNKNWVGYQNRLQQGLLEHKVTTVSRDDGTEKVCEQVRVTPKGLARIAQELGGAV